MDVGCAFLHEDYFRCIVDQQTGKRAFDTLNKIVAGFLSARVPVVAARDVYDYVSGLNDAPLYELLFEQAASAGLDAGDVRDIGVLLDRCESWACPEPVPPVEVQCKEGAPPSRCAAVALAWTCAISGHMPALIVSGESVDGVIARLVMEERTKEVYLMGNSGQLVAYHRAVLSTSLAPDATFEKLAARAFPQILFAPGLRPSSLNVNFDTELVTFVRHLSYLADEYCTDAESVGWDQFKLQRVARTKGVTLSDESSNTKQSKKKIRTREVEISVLGKSKIFDCSLHTKIQAKRGRIHFCVERSENGHKMVVGIFHEHLEI
jgi:hypothetical protein